MRMRYFGDSYDIVKQSLLRWLRTLGDWSAHPMFTEAVSDADVAAFETLLGAEGTLARSLDARHRKGCILRTGVLLRAPVPRP